MMKGEWCLFKSYFTPEQCSQIIELSASLPKQKAEIGNNGTTSEDESRRRSVVSFIGVEDERYQWLFDELWKMALIANRDWFDYHLTKLDYIQFAEYDAEYLGEYKSHRDVFYITNDNYHRKLSAVIQLTDPSEYEGGDLQLHELQLEEPNPEDVRQQGSVLFFPSFILHQATPVTQGKRHSIAAWYYGPHWR
jgi:PKHD-type hydroxylase